MSAAGKASRYLSVKHEGARLFNVGILADGTLYNPNSYPDDVVREAVLAADARRHERRGRGAHKAAETRHRRRQLKVHAIARSIIAGYQTGPRHHCDICGRHLDDPASIARGIGSECWQDLLGAIEQMKAAAP